MKKRPEHPVLAFGNRRNWDRQMTAEWFGITPVNFRQIIGAFTGVSFERALKWADDSEGEFTALDVLLWHRKYRRMT